MQCSLSRLTFSVLCWRQGLNISGFGFAELAFGSVQGLASPVLGDIPTLF